MPFEFFLFTTRLIVGIFFCISGYHKLTDKQRHEMLVQTLHTNHIPLVTINQWFVPVVEFLAGMAMCFGMFWPLPILGLLAICLVAFMTDGIARIKLWKPIDKADWLDDILYLPETLYIFLLAALLFFGFGAYELGLNVFTLAEDLL